ncbi:amidase [Salinisphaera japonica]|uniref:Amidase n=1 Tax=Salinisphaera japonica YTM-1 TaxID=1209778 RepID=A0A423PZM8_9GAMM|nr:amidase [Salinisphaera japonica]ROO31157.1 amidase [Salinisphaera japonica YTM-1]
MNNQTSTETQASTIHDRSAGDLARAIREGETTARAALEHFIARHDALNAPLNAVVVQDFERAREAADAVDAAVAAGEPLGPLAGVPMTVKDTFEAEGLATVVGEPRLANYVAPHDAVAVARLKAAGAIVFGKTNTPRLAQDVQTYNDIYGTTNNPWDTSRTSGGSSGGAAAAVAAGITPIELGSDLAGSIRTPSAWCGIYGHKPSYGLVPMRGHIPGPPGTRAEPDLCVAGPLSRHPGDLSLMLDALAGPSAIEASAWHVALPASPATRLADFRIASYFGDDFAPIAQSVGTAIQAMRSALTDHGAAATAVAALPGGFADSYDLYDRLLNALVGAGLPDKLYTKARRGAALMGLLKRTERGTLGGFATRATDTHRDWAQRNEARQALRETWQAFFADYDVLLMPVVGVPAIEHQHKGSLFDRKIPIDGQDVAYTQLFRWIAPATLAGLPATTAPIGISPEGLPIALQIVGAYGADHTTIAFAGALKAAGIGISRPPGFE